MNGSLSSEQIGKRDASIRIARSLEKVRQALSIEKGDWADVLGITEREYNLVRSCIRPVSIASLNAAAQYLNVSLESFSLDGIDVCAIAARFRGDTKFLRERYSEGALSRRWSSINILDYVEQYIGWELRALALKHLQVSEAVFSEPEKKISLRF